MTSCWAENTLPPPSVPAPAVRSAPAAMVLSAANAFCVHGTCQAQRDGRRSYLVSILLWVGFVDPRGRGQSGWPGRPHDKALRGALIGLGEDAGPLFVDV